MEVITGAMSTLLPKLGDLLKEEYKLQKGVRGEVMFLKAELESMEAALQKVSDAPIDQPPDIQLKLWAREVKELSYDIEDRVDSFMVRIDRAPKELHCLSGFIERILELLTKAKIRHSLGTDIKDLRRRIEDVSTRRDRYKVDQQVPHGPASMTVDNLRLLPALYRKATELVGIEKKSSKLIEMLMEGNEASKKQLRIVSIAGFGGIGKTTLANEVYQKLKGQFDCGAFVSVSHSPNTQRIFIDMLQELGMKNIQSTSGQQQLIGALRNFLTDKMYIIVVDDIWNTSVWETIQFALIENECGSRIITTTRNIDVAKQASVIYKMEPLSLPDSTKLFYQRIFGSKDKFSLDERVQMSVKILEKCGGVPLAIITIASLLSNKSGNKSTQNYWTHVYESMGSGLDGSTNVQDMRRILSVSYYDLPSHLKPCFLYLSLFPEDCVIDTEHLIWKWIGEGFVHKEQGRTLHEVGEVYIQELVNRSMIQAVKIGGDGKIITCRVHDMVLDLASFLSMEEYFVTKLGGQQHISLPNKIRRLSLQISHEDEVKQHATMDFSHVRSLTVTSEGNNFPSMPNLSSFPVLRVLDLRNFLMLKNNHFKDICNMFHLRYLDIRGKFITDEITKEIQNIKFLLVLIIRLNSVPRWMPSLCSLSFLDIELFFLGEQDLQVLGSLPCLSHLKIKVSNTTRERDQRLVIGKCYPFQCLTWLQICDDTMGVMFAPGAMQNLKELRLEFWAQKSVDKFGDSKLGLEHLSSLENVAVETTVRLRRTLRTTSVVEAVEDEITRRTTSVVEAVEDEIKKSTNMNPGKPTLIMDRNRIESHYAEAAVHVHKAAINFIDGAKYVSQSGIVGPKTNRK